MFTLNNGQPSLRSNLKAIKSSHIGYWYPTRLLRRRSDRFDRLVVVAGRDSRWSNRNRLAVAPAGVAHEVALPTILPVARAAA